MYIDECLQAESVRENVIIISGGCRGADRLGEMYALEKGFTVNIYNADWARYGRGAGPIRNRRMVENADIIICFWDKKSKGTLSLIRLATCMRKKIYIKYV